MRYYLTSPSLDIEEKETIRKLSNRLRLAGHDVYIPMEHEVENEWNLTETEWARKKFADDMEAIRKCDEVICVYYGLYNDNTTAWECGFACGVNKTVNIVTFIHDEIKITIINGKNSLDKYQK